MLRAPGKTPFSPDEEAVIFRAYFAGQDPIRLAAAFKSSPFVIEQLINGSLRGRLLKKVRATPEGCWKWVGALATHRCPVINVNGKTRSVAQVMYEMSGHTPIRRVGHLCGNPLCVRPDHLLNPKSPK